MLGHGNQVRGAGLLKEREQGVRIIAFGFEHRDEIIPLEIGPPVLCMMRHDNYILIHLASIGVGIRRGRRRDPCPRRARSGFPN